MVTLQKIKDSYCAGFNYSFREWTVNDPLSTEEKEGSFSDSFGKVTLYLINHGDLDELAFLKNIPMDNSLSPLNKDLISVYAKTLYLIAKEQKRVDIWDALFESPYVKNNEIYRVILSSYYNLPEYKEGKKEFNYYAFALQTALYHFWHRTPFTSSLRKSAISYDNKDFLGVVGALNSEGFSI